MARSAFDNLGSGIKLMIGYCTALCGHPLPA